MPNFWAHKAWPLSEHGLRTRPQARRGLPAGRTPWFCGRIDSQPLRLRSCLTASGMPLILPKSVFYLVICGLWVCFTNFGFRFSLSRRSRVLWFTPVSLAAWPVWLPPQWRRLAKPHPDHPKTGGNQSPFSLSVEWDHRHRPCHPHPLNTAQIPYHLR